MRASVCVRVFVCVHICLGVCRWVFVYVWVGVRACMWVGVGVKNELSLARNSHWELLGARPGTSTVVVNSISFAT